MSAFNHSTTPPSDGQQPSKTTLTTGQFLRLYFRQVDNGYVELTYLAPDGVKLYPRTVVKWRQLPIGDVAHSPKAIQQANRDGYSIFFGTTVSGVKHDPEQRISEKSGKPYTHYPRRKEADVTYAPSLWVDIDDVTPEEGRARLLQAPVPPTIMVQSGGGMHGYWLLNDPVFITPENKHEFKRTLHGLASFCGGDTKTRDLARIMRLPGTVNTKPERNNALCEVHDCFPAYYQYHELRDFFLQHAPRELPSPTREIPAAATDKSLPRYVTDFIQHGAPSGERNHKLYVCACFYRDAGYPQMQAENELAPAVIGGDFTNEEAMRTIASAYRGDAKPSLPRHMATRMAIADSLKGGRS